MKTVIMIKSHSFPELHLFDGPNLGLTPAGMSRREENVHLVFKRLTGLQTFTLFYRNHLHSQAGCGRIASTARVSVTCYRNVSPQRQAPPPLDNLKLETVWSSDPGEKRSWKTDVETFRRFLKSTKWHFWNFFQTMKKRHMKASNCRCYFIGTWETFLKVTETTYFIPFFFFIKQIEKTATNASHNIHWNQNRTLDQNRTLTGVTVRHRSSVGLSFERKAAH